MLAFRVARAGRSDRFPSVVFRSRTFAFAIPSLLLAERHAAGGRAVVRGDTLALTRVGLPQEDPLAVVARGALAVSTDPPEILRHGVRIALSPSEVVLMSLLVRRGRASWAVIAETLREAKASMGSLETLVHRIRRKFAMAGAPDPIDTRRGWGLVLRVEPDFRGTSSLWIGANSDDLRERMETAHHWVRRA